MRMRRSLLTVIGVLGLTTLGIHAQQQLQLFARIVDGKGMPVASLEPGDVTFKENDVELKVVKIDPINWPIKVQLLVDNGIGLGNDNLANIRTGLRGLIEALPEGTEITFVTTAPQPRIVLRPTTDRMAQLKGLDLLTPDSGAGRFVESLNEAMQRVERDKTDFFPVIISAGTTSGDMTSNLESTYKQLIGRLQKRPATIHVVMFSKSTGQAATNAGVQQEVGIQLTQAVHGRYEAIAVGSRLATLLPELGAQVAKSHENQSHQFRITVARGSSGNIGNLSLATKSGLSATSLTMDGRIP
jgi:hypothetical protein